MNNILIEVYEKKCIMQEQLSITSNFSISLPKICNNKLVHSISLNVLKVIK